MPNIADYRSKFPSLRDLDDNALISRVAEVQGVDPEDVIAHMGYKPKSRSLMAVANDTVIEAANATAGAVGSAADFISPGNRLSSFIDEKIIRPGEASQSDVTQQSRRQFQQEVEQADGIGGELMAVGRKVLRDPLLTAAQAAGSFVIPGMGVKAAGAAAGAMVPAALRTAAAAGDVAAAAQIAQITSRAGLAGGATAGAALSGGDAAGTAYDLVIKAGGSEEDAVAAARQASVLPAVVGGLGGLVGAERLLAGAGGVKGGIMARALKTGGIEGAQEGFEEGITQYEGQRAAMPFDSTIDPMKGAYAAAGMGAVMGAGIGGVTGALTADPAEAQQRLATAPDVAGMVKAANDLAMAPLTYEAPGFVPPAQDLSLAPIGQGADGIPFEADPSFAGRELVKGGQRPLLGERFSSKRQADIAIGERGMLGAFDSVQVGPNAWIINEVAPVGEATEIQPEVINADVGFMRFRSPQQIAADGMPTIPTGTATEFDPIPAGDAVELEQIPAGEATELDTDLKTGDGMPYGTQSGAVVRAKREGLTPAEVVKVAGGWVVRPQPTGLGTAVDGRPNNTRGTNAADVLRGTREPVTDLAGTSSRLAGATDGRGDQPGGSGRAVRPVPDGAGGLVQVPAAPVAGGAANATLADGARQPDPALTTGSRVNYEGKTWTVIDASPSMVRLDDGQGTRRAISPTSAKWKQVTPAEPSRPDEAGQGAPDAAQVDQPAGAAISTDALKQNAGPTNNDAQPTTSTTRGQAPETAAATQTPAGAAPAAGGAVEADGLTKQHKVGDLVKLTKPGVNGRVNIAGTVTAILADGRLEVKTQQDGYFKVAPSELGHKPQAGAPNATAPVEAASTSGAAAPAAVAPNVSTDGAESNTSAERVQKTPESEQVAPLKDRVDAKRKPAETKPAEPETALPAADSTPTPELPAASTASVPKGTAGTAGTEPKPKRPPKSFRKTHMVSTSVFVEESGKFETREVDADTALKALDEDIAEMTAFRRCITGG